MGRTVMRCDCPDFLPGMFMGAACAKAVRVLLSKGQGPVSGKGKLVWASLWTEVRKKDSLAASGKERL